jgi:hypothetical protein
MWAGELYVFLNGFCNQMANENRILILWICMVVLSGSVGSSMGWKEHPKQIFFHQYKFQICNLLWLGDLFSSIYIYNFFCKISPPKKKHT